MDPTTSTWSGTADREGGWGSPAGCYPCGSRRGLVAFSMQPINEGVIAKRGESIDAWSSLSTNQIDGVARRETHCHERSSHDDARSVEPLGAVDEHPSSRGHERGDEHGHLAHVRVDLITVVHREAHIESAERYRRCPGRLPVLEIDDHVDVERPVLRAGVQPCCDGQGGDNLEHLHLPARRGRSRLSTHVRKASYSNRRSLAGCSGRAAWVSRPGRPPLMIQWGEHNRRKIRWCPRATA